MPFTQQKRGLLAAKGARKGSPKRQFSAFEERLPNHVAQNPARLLLSAALLSPNLVLKVGRTGCKKSQERVPEKAAFGVFMRVTGGILRPMMTIRGLHPR